MDLKLAFDGIGGGEADPVLKSAEVIIPYFKYSKQDAQASYVVTVEPVTVISFAGMVQDLCNKAKGKATLENDAGQKVEMQSRPGYTMGDIEKEMQVFL